MAVTAAVAVVEVGKSPAFDCAAGVKVGAQSAARLSQDL